MRITQKIPVLVAHQAASMKMYKHLYQLLQMKDCCGGVFYEGDFITLRIMSSTKSLVTFKKRVDKMIEMGWIKRIQSKGMYRLVSFNKIAEAISKKCSNNQDWYWGGKVWLTNNITQKTIQSFLMGVIVSRYSNRAKRHYTKTRDGRRDARTKGMAYIVGYEKGNFVREFGVGMKKISEVFGVTRQRASQIKKTCSLSSFVSFKKRECMTSIVPVASANIKRLSGLNDRYLFRKLKHQDGYGVFLQLPDSVHTNLFFQ